MFWRKRINKFQTKDQVGFINPKQLDLAVLQFYGLHPSIRTKPGEYLGLFKENPEFCRVNFLVSDGKPMVEYVVPISLLKIYEKEPAHRLTRVFL